MFKSDAQTTDAGTTNGQVEVTTEAWDKVWSKWAAYYKYLGVHPYLDRCNFNTITQVATMCRSRIRKGYPVDTGSVRAGVGGINTTIALDTGRQPLHQHDGKHYIKTIQHMLTGFKKLTLRQRRSLSATQTCQNLQCVRPTGKIIWRYTRQLEISL